ncbi:membrane protein [Mesorhizobium sp. LSJC268A00]|uniref:membrane protein n=1 Tax=unclassified Mesorhizobium TaxID=325217 RepID=UPI0003CEE491|nr:MULTISPECIES: membrane protein [unclassified Mesorhizobium]ESX06472.1 membrane protein [Mesorhizobium sp. LSJC268A00]ESX13113.1 membrane protein [Mesorhizobium sp. LSJC265A00]ESZ70495.1 membrane protein [Mesorhizobium sp. L103C119B0]
MNWSVSFEPLLSWPLLALVLAPLLVLAAVGLWFRQRGAIFRFAALIALGAALLNPVFLDEEREALKSVVAVIVDRSQSQDIGDRTKQTDEALAGLQQRLGRFKQFDVRVVEAGKSEAADELTETKLFAALEGAFRDVPPSRIGGAIMITDGEVHDAPAAPDFNAPLHALITGNEHEKDRRIRFENAPRFGLVGKPLDMTYRVIATDGETGPVDVRVSVNGEQVAVEEATIGQAMPLQVTIPGAGRNIVELSIDREPGELTDANNRAIALIDGIRENLRVLLVSGEPHAGERTWRNLLKSDASVDLVHFTILRPPEKQDGTPINELSLIAFPTRELFVEKIKDFDLIIFDRYQHRDVLPILYYDYISEYVEKGGALLIAAGPEYAGDSSIARTPLMSSLPAMPTGEVIDKAFYPRLTDLGQRHPVTRGLDGSATEPPRWSRWFRTIGVQNPEGEVVMKGADNRPLLLLDHKGEGRVGMLLSDQGWLWARGFEGGGPHVQLYRRIAHWLMKEPELEEERLTADGRGMMLEIRRQTMSDDPGPAQVITPSGKALIVKLEKSEPGVFLGSIETKEIGLYQIGNGDLTALAHVGPVNAPEFSDVVSTEDRLKAPTEATGGSVRRLAASSTLGQLTGSVALPSIVPVRASGAASGADWIGLRSTDDSVLKAVSRVPLFGGFLGLCLLLLAMGAMWYREGR